MSDEKKAITTTQLQQQVAAYSARLPQYELYAAALKRVLEKACKAAFPDAFVQARPKAVTSFAEKCVRRFEKYPDAVNQLTDLCGGRVIVQTVEQVGAVRQFIDANFAIVESDEKGLQLGEKEFGYRDMHYIVQLLPEKAVALGFTPDEITAIGDKRAEIQVRTWVQHAWADTLHDRVYKNPLELSADIKRTGNLQAALMEQADRNYSAMANELDGMLANYHAFATRQAIESEIAIQRMILESEAAPARAENDKRPGLALKLARLQSACGDFAGVAKTLEPYRDVRDAHRSELLQELGYATCRAHRAEVSSRDYQQGIHLLQQAVEFCDHPEAHYVQNSRQQEGLRARALARLGWSLEGVPGQRQRAAEFCRRAHECEPGNPYYLAEMLGIEASSSSPVQTAAAMRTMIRGAIETCRTHASQGTELPYAYFTAGRLSLLLNDSHHAVGFYARGIRHCLDQTHCFPADVMREERVWLLRFADLKYPPDACPWVLDLFDLAEKLPSGLPTPVVIPPKALILSGGAATLDAAAVQAIRPLVMAALEPMTGPVLSGGTSIGIPGCAGDVARELAGRGAKKFKLLGYIPQNLPADAPKDPRYDEVKVCGDAHFTAEQIVAYWKDLFSAGIQPRDVLCLGFGGGGVSLMEYQVALAFGATAAVVSLEPEDAAARLACDPLWRKVPNLLPVPRDLSTIRALVVPAAHPFDEQTLQNMAMAFHREYVSNSAGRLPDTMKPWDKLKATFQTANLEQARYAVQILDACGFVVQPARDPAHPVLFKSEAFKPEDVERMAELEHGRWNLERLRNGWRYGRPRDDARKIHDCLVNWKELPDGENGVKKYDRTSVRKFPEILAQAGLEVYKRTG